MNKKTELLHFYENYYNSIDNLEKENEYADKFYQALLSGDNEVYQKYISETKVFDENWIKTVESYVPSLNKIIQNPRSSIKLEQEIVIIEKAKNINVDSVKHLASNTHLIKEVKEDGEVVPQKILTTFKELDYGTYENRFIMTLIDRLYIFVRNRYDLIKTNIESYERRRFYLKSNFPINYTNVDIEINLTLVDEIEDKEITEHNKKLLKRVEYLNKIVTSLKGSNFMELMKPFKRVYPPIMKTNVILKNVDFRNSYLLWLFLDRYNTLAFNAEVEEKDLTFTDRYFTDINRQLLTLYSAIVANQQMNKEEYETIKARKRKKKSVKIKRQHPDDFLLTPEDIEMEDLSLNEYYLNANKQIFKQALEYHEQTSATYETSVKRALRETLNISNALYESFFELDDQEDIFTRLVKEVDANEELKEARRKLLISRLIREVKEVDLNNALRQEKKFLDDIAKFDQLLLREHKKNLENEKEQLDRIENIRKDREQALLEKEIVDQKLKENKYYSDEINKYRNEVNKKINDYKRELNKQFIDETKQYKNQIEQLTNDEIEQYRLKHKPTRIVTDENLNKEKLVMDEKYINEKDLLIAYYNQTITTQKEEIKNASEEKIAQDKAKYEEMLENNERNLAILAASQQKYEEHISLLKNSLEQEKEQSLNEYKLKIIQEETEQIAINRQKYKITTRLTDNKLNRELAKLEQKLIKEKEKLEKQYQKEIETKKQKLISQSTNKLNKLINELKTLKQANTRNLTVLKEAEKIAAKGLEK